MTDDTLANLSATQKRTVVDRIVLAFLHRAGIDTTVTPTENGLTLELDFSTNLALPPHLARLMPDAD